MKRRLHSVLIAFLCRPRATVWLRCAGLYLIFLLLAALLGFSTGFLKIEWMDASGAMYALTAARIAVTPALFEELFFRALPIPHPSENKSARHVAIACTLSLAVFVAVHPVDGLLFRADARAVFTDPVFLTMAGLLGLVCTLAYRISSSIWPPVAMHWMTVAVWTLCLGGKRMLGVI